MPLETIPKCKLAFLSTEHLGKFVYCAPAPYSKSPGYEIGQANRYSTCHAIAEPVELINAVLMINWVKFLAEAENIFNGAALQNKALLETSVKLLLDTIRKKGSC